MAALHGDLGTSIATGRPVLRKSCARSGNTVTLAIAASLIGFTLGLLFGLIAGYFRDTWIDKLVTTSITAGVSVPHYWLGMVLVIIFSVQLNWLPAVGAGPGGSGVGLGLGAHEVSDPAGDHDLGDPDGHRHPHGARADRRHPFAGFRRGAARQGPARAGRVQARRQERRADRARGDGPATRLHARRLDPDRDGVLLAGLGLLLNSAIFQRDLPLLQGTILVLALFFVALNLLVDIAQAAIDPRIKRG